MYFEKLPPGIRAKKEKEFIEAVFAQERGEKMKLKLYEPKTAEDAVKAWDRGETLWSIEMGGLGPGYEQAIQVAAIELCRDLHDKPLPTHGNIGNWGDKTFSRIDAKVGGITGAMAGAAKQLAYQAIKTGWAGRDERARKQFKKEGREDRMIQISNRWPRT